MTKQILSMEATRPNEHQEPHETLGGHLCVQRAGKCRDQGQLNRATQGIARIRRPERGCENKQETGDYQQIPSQSLYDPANGCERYKDLQDKSNVETGVIVGDRAARCTVLVDRSTAGRTCDVGHLARHEK